MLAKRILLGTSLLLLEATATILLAALKISKIVLRLAEKPFRIIARGMDKLTHPINRFVSDIVENITVFLANGLKNNRWRFHGSLVAEMLGFLTPILLSVFCVGLNVAYCMLQQKGFLMLMGTSIVTATLPASIIIFANIIFFYAMTNLWKANMKILALRNFQTDLPNSQQELDQYLKARASLFENACSGIFGLLKLLLMIPVHIINKPMVSVQRHLKAVYSSQQQIPWYVPRVQKRLAQLQVEIKADAKPENFITSFSSQQGQTVPVLSNIQQEQSPASFLSTSSTSPSLIFTTPKSSASEVECGDVIRPSQQQPQEEGVGPQRSPSLWTA